MRHRNAGKKLSRNSSHRKALLANLITNLITYEKIQTTHAKAVVLKSQVEKVITLGKRQDIASRRMASKIVRTKDALHKLFSEIGPRFQNRHGGYTRIIKTLPRHGDNAPMSVIEILKAEGPVETKPEIST